MQEALLLDRRAHLLLGQTRTERAALLGYAIRQDVDVMPDALRLLAHLRPTLRSNIESVELLGELRIDDLHCSQEEMNGLDLSRTKILCFGIGNKPRDLKQPVRFHFGASSSVKNPGIFTS